MGPPGVKVRFLKFFVSRERFGFNEALWLMGNWETLLSEAGFEKVFRTRIGSVEGSCFVDDFVSCKRGPYRLLLEPS